MIRCHNCQEENMIGVIFCRGCGKKLEIDDITPEDVAGQARKEKPQQGLRGIIAFLLLIGIIAVGAMLFVPPAFTAPNELKNEQELSQAERKFRRILGARTGGDETFTYEEAANLTRIKLGLTPTQVAEARTRRKEEGTSMYLVPEEYHIIPTGENTFDAVLKSTMELNDSLKFPVYTTLHCRIENTGERIDIIVDDAAMGRVPMFRIPFLVRKMASRHTILTSTQELEDLYRAITSASMQPDGTVRLQRKAGGS